MQVMKYLSLLVLSIHLSLLSQSENDWIISDITIPGQGGPYVSLSIVDNKPVITFFDLIENKIVFAIRNDNGRWNIQSVSPIISNSS
jgi:hypothetical protein